MLAPACKTGLAVDERPEMGSGAFQGAGMACIDIDSLAQFESDAKNGRAEALYNLGLAYSTGQGVDVDYIAAHKWFNLAAMKGSEIAKNWRAQISREMNSNQIAEAQRLAREWLSVVR
jgi:TPR repeat protein